MQDRKMKVKVKKKKVDDLKEIKSLLLRVQADFDNYRKRTQSEKEEYGKYLNTDLVLQILPVLDNFKLALRHQPKEIEGNVWAEGIWHIEKQLEQILTNVGVEEIKSLGEKFNPHLHEAIGEVDSARPPGEITEVMQAGYKLGDRVIRHAKVKVSKLKKGAQNE